MPRRASQHPTEAELEILNVLWLRGPSTVNEVHEALQADRSTSLTTTLKLMQIMLQKGLVRRDDRGHAHVYKAAVTRKRTQQKMVGQLVDQVFEGSAQQLVMQALSVRKSSPEELDEIRQLLDKLERESK